MYRKKGTFRKNGTFRKKVAKTIQSLRETKYRDYDTTTYTVQFRNGLGLSTLRQVKPIFYITNASIPGTNNYNISQGDGHQDRTGDSVQFRGFRLQTTITVDYTDTNLTTAAAQYVQKRIRRMVIAVRISEGLQTLPYTSGSGGTFGELFDCLPQGYQD